MLNLLQAGQFGRTLLIPASGIAQPDSLLHFEGANNSTTFTDERGALWSVTGGANISTAQAMFGSSSGYFSNGYISATLTPFGTSDFCVEMFCRRDAASGNQVVFDSRAEGTATGIGIYVNTSAYGQSLAVYGDEIIAAAGSIPNTTFTHIAVTREASVLRGFVAGSKVFEAFHPVNLTNSVMSFGGNTYSQYFGGYLDEARITNGSAVYTSNFTPPAAPFS